MFKKTKIKIIVSVMAAITLLLFGTLSIILVTSYAQMTNDNKRMLEQYVRDYRIDDEKTGDLRNGMTDMPFDNSAAQKPDEPPPEELHKYDISTFYSVAVSSDGSVLKINNDSGNLYSDEKLKSFADEVISGNSKTGRIKNLEYIKAEKDGYTLVAFIDNVIMQGNIATVFRNTLIFSGISVIAVFIASIFLSKRIVAPVEETFEKQKNFISDAGHELKTPVSVISANADLLSRQVGENQWLANIIYENERMGNLVKQLLQLAKTENAEVVYETVDLSRIVSGELLPFESVAFENGLILKSDIDNRINVTGDPTMLKQLTSILIDNAIRHNKGEKDIQIKLKSEHSYAKLSVINYGEKIPEEQQKHIFERFYRVDSARSDDGHFGLGLAIAKSIADSHKGKIMLSCYDGKVEFSAYIPLKK